MQAAVESMPVLSEAPAVERDAELVASLIPASRSALSDGPGRAPVPGLLTNVVKRTGASIAKTGAWTGSSIFDAVRGVSGIVRRALPTN
jgi:hypothetical protein